MNKSENISGSEEPSENSADLSKDNNSDGESVKPSNDSFYDNFFKDKSDDVSQSDNSPEQSENKSNENEKDSFAETDFDSMFHYPPKGTLPPPGYGGVNYGAYGNPYAPPPYGNPQTGYYSVPNGVPMQGGYNPNPNGVPMQGGYNPNPNGAPMQGGYNPNPNGAPMQGAYNQSAEYRQSTYNPYGGSAVYVPKKKSLSNGALMAIIITISVLFIIILIILAFTSIGVDQSTDYSSQSSEYSETAESGNSGVTVEIPIQQKPALEAKYYQDEETGLLTVEGVAQRVSPSVVDVLVYRDTSLYAYSAGSGIIISEDGYIVTNAHVVTEANAGLKVTLGDGTEYEAEIIGADNKTDIAVLKIEAEDLVTADFGDSDELLLGEMVVAIGNAGGYSGTLTVGYVSGLNREITTASSTGSTMTCIQTDAAMSPGVSGGALINMYGQVVGITSSKYKSTELDEGIGFAITTKFAMPIIEDIISKGYISGRVRIGITYVAISSDMADAYGVKMGIQVKSIDDTCDISETELREGDIITSINGIEVYSSDTIKKAMEGINPGDTVQAHVYRKGITSGDEIEFDIEFEAMQDTSLS